MQNRKQLLMAFFLGIGFFMGDAKAQSNDTNHPYSMFGLGELEVRDYGINAGMSGVGIGMTSKDAINTVNPASLVSINPKQVYLEIAVGGKYSKFDEGAATNSVFNGNFKKLALATQMKKNWAMGISISPYSSVGYTINTETPVEGTTGTASDQFQGTGGLYKISLTNSVSIFDKLYIGANMNYLSGNIYQTEAQSTISIEDKMSASRFCFDLGLQYLGKFNNGWDYNLGMIWSPKINLDLYNTKSVGGVEESHSHENATIPSLYGIGFSLNKMNNYSKWTFAADYSYQDWSKQTLPDTKFNRFQLLNAGIQYIPNARESSSLFKNCRYQLGFKASESYILVGGEPIKNYSTTIGFVFPTKSNVLFHINTEIGIKKTNYVHGIDEQYFSVNFGISYIEKLAGKRKIQ